MPEAVAPARRAGRSRHERLPARRDTRSAETTVSRPLQAADVMTAAEVGALLRVPRSTVEDWARRGTIPSRKIGRRRVYVRQHVEALLLDEAPTARIYGA